MPISNTNYICCRCNYETKLKSHMKQHLFQRTTVCPAKNKNIVLTDEIKNIIINERVYHIPKESKKPSIIQQQNIQNIQINNYIKNNTMKEKLMSHLEFKDQELMNISDTINQQFENRNNRMENYSFKYGYDIDEERFYDIIDEVSQMRNKDFRKLNIAYDNKLKILSIYDDGSWLDYSFKKGTIKLIQKIKEGFFDNYEKYLIVRIKLKEKNVFEQARLTEKLELYYKFLVSFNLIPWVNERCDVDIVGLNNASDDKYNIEEYFMKKYSDIKKTTKKSEITELTKDITIKVINNTNNNLKTLDESVKTTIKSEEDYNIKI